MVLPEFTSRIQKGGALLADMRQLVCQWAVKPSEVPPDRYVAEVLQKPTRARAEDTYQRAFLPRFIASCPRDAWKLCAEIEKHVPPIEIIRLFYYWLTARAEPILYRYVTEELFQVARVETVEVRVDDLTNWIRNECRNVGKKWSDIVTIKTARAMLAALRDFGILEGASKKRLAPTHLPVETFCLIAFCLRSIVRNAAISRSTRIGGSFSFHLRLWSVCSVTISSSFSCEVTTIQKGETACLLSVRLRPSHA